MNTNYSKDAPTQATIPFLTLSDPATGLSVQVLKPAYESALRRKQPIVITIYPEDSLPDASSPMNEEDEVIAEIINLNPGLSRDEIIRLAEANYSTILSVDSFKNRFRKGQPLHTAGYHATGRARNATYHPPQV